jgi:hypothetical protein
LNKGSKASSRAKFANAVETSGDLPSNGRQSIDSKRRNHASLMHEIIALLEGCRGWPSHNSAGKK